METKPKIARVEEPTIVNYELIDIQIQESSNKIYSYKEEKRVNGAVGVIDLFALFTTSLTQERVAILVNIHSDPEYKIVGKLIFGAFYSKDPVNKTLTLIS